MPERITARLLVPERAATLLVALALDALVGDVGGGLHPVALLGRLLDALHRPFRQRRPAVELSGGALSLAVTATAAAGLCWGMQRACAGRTWRVLVIGALLKPTFAIRGLLHEGTIVATALEQDGVGEARQRLRALVSRPTAALDSGLIASAAIESLAENLGDSVAAPLLLYSLFGLPGAAVYRVINTADAMVGYRGETEWLGKPAARLDDALNLVPSRLAALSLVAAAAVVSGPAAAASAWSVCRRDRARTRSPNAGTPMAAMAGALGRRLEKRQHYVLGEGLVSPAAADVHLAVRLTAVAAGLLAALALVVEVRR